MSCIYKLRGEFDSLTLLGIAQYIFFHNIKDIGQDIIFRIV